MLAVCLINVHTMSLKAVFYKLTLIHDFWIFMDSISQSSLVSNPHDDDLHWQDEREMRDSIWAPAKYYLYGYLK